MCSTQFRKSKISTPHCPTVLCSRNVVSWRHSKGCADGADGELTGCTGGGGRRVDGRGGELSAHHLCTSHLRRLSRLHLRRLGWLHLRNTRNLFDDMATAHCSPFPAQTSKFASMSFLTDLRLSTADIRPNFITEAAAEIGELDADRIRRGYKHHLVPVCG